MRTIKQLYKIDSEGFLLAGEEIFIKDDETIPEGYIDKSIPVDENGWQLPFWQLKWTGVEWIEGATQEVIDELTKPQTYLPSEDERIKSLEDAMVSLLLGGI